MKEFFHVHDENHQYGEDLKLAKFWKGMKGAELNQIWGAVAKKQDEVIAEIKKTEMYQKCKSFDEIEEELSEGMDQSEDDSAQDYPYR